MIGAFHKCLGAGGRFAGLRSNILGIKSRTTLFYITLSLTVLLVLKSYLLQPPFFRQPLSLRFGALRSALLFSAGLHRIGHLLDFDLNRFECSSNYRQTKRTDHSSCDDET